MKRIVATILVIIMLLGCFSLTVNASGGKSERDSSDTDKEFIIGEIGGYLVGNINTVKNLVSERSFNWSQGHGFAAEKGNNLIDVLTGKRSKIVGGDNAANGPDRMIIDKKGVKIYIQDKYYGTATKSVNAAFDDTTGLYRYFDVNGKPMELEVPLDQYEEAIEKMAKKIADGKVPGVTDPNEAKNLIRKSHLTYKQAVNLTKAGTVESLTYDAANGAIVATSAMGISFVIDFALRKLSGQDFKEAVKDSALDGLKAGGVVFATYVISSQLMKTGLNDAMSPLASAVEKSLGEGVKKVILQISGKSAAELTSVIKTNIVTSAVLVIVLTTPDMIDLFRGRISKKQFLKNLTVTVVALGGTYVGTMAGGAIGSLILPGVGTVIGGLLGGIIGGTAAAFVIEKGLSAFLKNDSDEMYKIISAKYAIMCGDYLLNETEAEALADQLKAKLSGKLLKDMYQSKNREKFAEEFMRPMFEEIVAKREIIKMPTVDETRTEMMAMLAGVVFLH